MLIAAVLMCGSAIAEAVFRGIDGYRLDAIALRRVREPRIPVGEDTPDLQYAMKVPRPSSVSMAWYVERPQPIPKIPMTAELRKRADSYPTEPWSPFFEWNSTYLRERPGVPRWPRRRDGSVCVISTTSRARMARAIRPIAICRTSARPGWFVTNSFGWRGPDIAAEQAGEHDPDRVRRCIDDR